MKRLRDFCDEMEGLVYGNEIFQTRTRGIGVIPAAVGPELRPDRAPTCGPRASTGTCAATPTSASPTTSSTSRSGPTPTATAGPAAGCASRRSARPPSIVDQLLRRAARRADHGQGAPHHQGARGRGLRGHREPARRDGLLRRLQGRHRPVPREDPLGQLQQHLDRAVAAPGRLRARHHHDPGAACTSSWGTSTDDVGGLPHPRRAPVVLAADDHPVACRARVRHPRRGHVRHRLPVQDDELHAEPARAHGGRAARLPPAPGRGRQVPPEGGPRPGPGRRPAVQAGARTWCWPPPSCSWSSCRSGPTPTSPTSTPASSWPWGSRRSRSSASSSPAGRRRTSTR